MPDSEIHSLPVISGAELAERRRRFMQQIGGDSIAILPAAVERVRNRDVHYPFRQNSDFLYLTGFNEPDAIAVFAPGREAGEFLLFCRDRDPAREIWDGLRAGPDGAREYFGADEAAPVAEFEAALPNLLAGRERLHYELGAYPKLDKSVLGALNGLRDQGRRGVAAPHAILAPDTALHEMRVVKSAQELAMMRAAARTSAAAHCRAMRVARPGMMEYRVAAEIHHEFERDGMTPAYPSIVGGGANGCILHYIENRSPLADGDMLLIDAGAEYQGYAADITRSFPVNGRFSGVQREVYEIVLAAQRAAIDAVRAGSDYNAPHRAAVAELSQGLIDLGCLKGEVDGVIEREAYRAYYMHGTGHWLGLDVHDVGDYQQAGEWRELQPGMTLTIEPGLYFPAGTEGMDARLADIGIRIEDDIAVTDGAPQVMTAEVPKTVDAIETLMAQGRE